MKHDLIIIGSGPAGMTAAIYAARYKMDTIIISKDVGGMASGAHAIENWPGTISISGTELMMNFKEHVKKFEVPIKDEEIVEADKTDDGFKITTKSNKTYESKAILLALGTVRRKLNVKGEEQFLGKGVSYCATCDAPFFKHKTVAVVGGNDSAAMTAVMLTDYADKIYIVYRKADIRCEPYWKEKIEKDEKIEVICEAEIESIHGDKFVEKIKLNNGKEMELQGVFIEIGSVPSTTLTKHLGVEMNKQDHIIAKTDMSTNVPGIYAAGDIIEKQLRQIVTACGDGATAANSIFKYIKEKKE